MKGSREYILLSYSTHIMTQFLPNQSDFLEVICMVEFPSKCFCSEILGVV